jgi:predicted nucleic-acid-binding Zn-ribbon protein
MQDGKCTKCGSDTVHRRDKGIVLNRNPFVDIAFFRVAVPTPYVCVSCGYTEFYLTDDSELAAIRDKWPQVAPNQSSSESR